MSEIIAGAGISDIFYIMGLTMVTCLIGFIGILGFMVTITLSNRPWYSSFFTHFPPPSQGCPPPRNGGEAKRRGCKDH